MTMMVMMIVGPSGCVLQRSGVVMCNVTGLAREREKEGEGERKCTKKIVQVTQHKAPP